GDPQTGMVARVPIPPSTVDMGGLQMAGYHDFYVGFDPASHQDRFYGGGKGGYYVYDLTNLKDPKLLTSITGVAGVSWVHTFTLMDLTNPYTVGFYRTYDGPHESRDVGNVNNGAWGVDIRNADGLIVTADMTTGFWAFKMDGFDGWNGHQWGMPNVSSAQDWD